MNSIALEKFLALLYTNDEARERFLANPREESARAGLSAGEVEAMAAIDRVGLELAAHSFAKKRTSKGMS